MLFVMLNLLLQIFFLLKTTRMLSIGLLLSRLRSKYESLTLALEHSAESKIK